MQRLTIVRYKVKPEFVAEDERLAGLLFDRLARETPPGINYAMFREQDGQSFVHVFANMLEDGQGVLADLPEFEAFSADIEERCEASLDIARLSVEMRQAYRSPTI